MKQNIFNLIERYQTFLRYAIVGVLGTLIDLFSLYFLTELSGIDPKTSLWFPVFVGIAFFLAVINNYLFNRLWTFKSQGKKRSEFLRFLVVSLVGLAATQALMWFLVSVLHIWYMLGKAITSLVVLIWNFSINKLWTFRSSEDTTQPPGKAISI